MSSAAPAPVPVLSLSDVRVGSRRRRQVREIVRGVDLEVLAGEKVGVVGESGSGKTLTMLSMLRLLPRPLEVLGGQIRFEGRDITALDERGMQSVRGSGVAMVYQDPMTSLNPLLRVRTQLVETLRAHGVGAPAARERTREVLGQVGFVDPERVAAAFPHELSGGMVQRVMIAMAIATSPRLLVADEPTTALDVTIQQQILDLVDSLQERTAMAVVWVSHDLGVIARLVDRVCVMYAGRVVEIAPTRQLFARPAHPYSKALLGSLPGPEVEHRARLTQIGGSPPDPTMLQPGCPFRPRCPFAVERCAVEEPPLLDRQDGKLRGLLEGAGLVVLALRALDLVKLYPARHGPPVQALQGVSVELESGRTLGIVGESGCGKSTLARLLVGLERPTSGTIELFGEAVVPSRHGDIARSIQLVFQDPYSSLDPRLTVAKAIGEVLAVHGLTARGPARDDRVTELLGMVALGRRFAGFYPHELSGGQAQRVAIARALAVQPKALVLDEPTSALDVSVRAEVINLLVRLQDELALSYVFISHDLATVRHLADVIDVMYLGHVVESGRYGEVLGNSLHPYTRALAEAVPVPDPARETKRRSRPAGEAVATPGASIVTEGCPYRPRCPLAEDVCGAVRPELAELRPGHRVACHVAARNETKPLAGRT